jgi:4'-phosphopantetheinyl transferase
MTNIYIYFTRFNQALSARLWKYYIDFLPEVQKKINARFIRWQDRHSHLFGKYLLVKAFDLLGYEKEELSNLKYNKYNRPYLNEKIDFNISHSGEYVVCVIGENIKVGIDIEEIREIQFDDFKKVMTKQQLQDIYTAHNPIKTFFKFWTIKESVIKADNRGLSIPLLDLHVKDNTVKYDNQIWYLNQLEIDENYCACLATNKKHIKIRTYNIDFFNKEKENLRLNEKYKSYNT